MAELEKNPSAVIQGLVKGDQTEFLKSILESSTDYSIIALDLDGAVMTWNEGARRIYGYTAAEMMGKESDLLLYAPDEANAAKASAVRAATLKKGKWVGDLRRIRKDGAFFTAHVTMTLRCSPKGEAVGFTMISKDLSEPERMSRELAESEEKNSDLTEKLENQSVKSDEQTSLLQESEEMFQRLAETGQQVFFLSSIDAGTMHFVSPSYAEVWGRSCESLYRNPQSWLDAIHPQDRESVNRALSKDGDDRHDFQYRILRNDGTMRWILARLEHIKVSAGRVRRLCGIAMDITDLKNAQLDLVKSELKYRRLFEAATDGVLILDAITGIIVEINPFLLNLLGYAAEECVGMKLWDIGFFKNVKISKELFKELQMAGYVRYEDLPLETKAGRAVQVEFVSNVYTVGGSSVIQCNIRDITEHKKSEAALRESETRYRVLFESNSDGIVITDLETKRFQHANPAICRMFGYSESEMRALGPADLHPEAAVPAAMADFDAMAGGGEPLASDIPCLRKDGTIFYADINGVKLVVDGRECAAGEFRDTTERKRSNDHLHRLASIVESSDDCILAVTLDGVIQSWNPASERVFGYAANEIIGTSPSILCPPHLREEQARLIAGVRSGANLQQHESVRVGKNGKPFDASISLFQNIDEWGKPMGYSAVIRDITKTKQLEAKLRQSQKMEGIGRLAGGIAHDFNNILTAILGFSEFLLNSLAPNDPNRDDVVQISKAGMRAATLTRQLLAFSRQQVAATKVLDVNGEIAELDKMLRRIVGEDIELTFIPGRDLGRVRAVPGQIEQIIMNLCVNAKDAMPNGGKLVLETSDFALEAGQIGTHPLVKAGPYVMIAVSDTGSGMTADVLSHVFEPFFTTKERGKGTGLGLSTVYGIVEQNGGNMEVHSELGHGTTFKIFFPRVDEPLAAAAMGPAALAHNRGSETILLVEDDETVREFAARVIAEDGYSILVAGTPAEALRISLDHKGDIQVMLTDVVMPGMLGYELAQRLASDRPEMKVVYMSGYTEQSIIQRAMLKNAQFLQKPMSREDIVREIRKALDSARG